MLGITMMTTMILISCWQHDGNHVDEFGHDDGMVTSNYDDSGEVAYSISPQKLSTKGYVLGLWSTGSTGFWPAWPEALQLSVRTGGHHNDCTMHAGQQ